MVACCVFIKVVLLQTQEGVINCGLHLCLQLHTLRGEDGLGTFSGCVKIAMQCCIGF